MKSSSNAPGEAEPAPEGPRSAFRSRLRAVAIVLGGFVLLYLVAEGLLRQFYYTPAREQVYTEHGWVKAPGSEVIQSGEGFSRSRVNSMGFYDDELLAERPPLRGLLLGDSYGEALQVPRDRNFSSVLEHEIPGLEVVNTAQSGRDPVDYAAYLRPLYDQLQPDFVIVQLNDGDIGDLRDSGYLGMDPEQVLADFLKHEPNVLKQRGRPTLAQWLAQHSALITYIYRRATILSKSEKGRLFGKFSPVDDADTAEDDVPADTSGAVDPRIGALMDGFYAHMREVTDRIIYVYIPAVNYSSGGCEPKFPERREFYHEFARRTGAVLVDATDALCREYQATRQPLHGFQNSHLGGGHINAEGHRVIGELLAQAVRDLPR